MNSWKLSVPKEDSSPSNPNLKSTSSTSNLNSKSATVLFSFHPRKKKPACNFRKKKIFYLWRVTLSAEGRGAVRNRRNHHKWLVPNEIWGHHRSCRLPKQIAQIHPERKVNKYFHLWFVLDYSQSNLIPKNLTYQCFSCQVGPATKCCLRANTRTSLLRGVVFHREADWPSKTGRLHSNREHLAGERHR